MNGSRFLCATALLASLLGAACDDDENDNDSAAGALRPSGSGGGTGASTNTAGSGTGAGSSSTAVPGGTSGGSSAGPSSGAAGAAGVSAPGAAGATGQGTAVTSPDAGASLDAGVPSAFGDAGAAELSDGQILGVVDILNAGEVEQAQAALPRLTEESVQAFANDMVTEHGAARQDLQGLAQMQGLALADSDLATQLSGRSAANIAALNAAAAGSVDALYIQLQVGAHGEALQLLDQLIEAADAPAVEAQLITLRGSVDAHLNRARELAPQ
jgi:putative membrane protein